MSNLRRCDGPTCTYERDDDQPLTLSDPLWITLSYDSVFDRHYHSWSCLEAWIKEQKEQV